MIRLKSVAVSKVNNHKYSITYTEFKKNRKTFKLVIDTRNVKNVEMVTSAHCVGVKEIEQHKEAIDYALDLATLLQECPTTIVGVYEVYCQKHRGIKEIA